MCTCVHTLVLKGIVVVVMCGGGRYSKELTHTIWGTDRYEIHRAGQQSGNSGESEGCPETEFLPHWRVSFFFLKSFNLFYSKSID